MCSCWSSLLDSYPECLDANGSIGFDWFVATVFLMMGGNVDRSWKFLFKFSSMMTSAFVWMQRIHCSVSQVDARLAMHFLPCAPCNAPLVLHFLQCTSCNALLEYALHIYITLAMRSLQYIPHNIFTFAAGTFVIICYLCCRYTCHNIFTCVAGTFVWIPGSERHSSGFLCHLSQRRTHPADGTSSGLLDIQDVRFLTCSGVYTCIPVLRLKNPLSYQSGQNTKNWKLKTVW